MNSMTGYGKGAANGQRKVTVEMKSVNHRFLDINFKLPRGFQFAEDVIRKVLAERVARGHIEVYLNYEDNRENKNDIVLNMPLAKRYLAAAKELVKLGYKNNFGAAEALKIPEITKIAETEDDETVIKELISIAAAECVERLSEMRRTEGEKLKEDLIQKVALLGEALSKIKERAPAVAADYKEKLQARINEALKGVELDPAKLAAEVAFFIDRSNIDEEITRLDGHIAHFGQVFSEAGPVGKKLDFLTQEANREVNTIASKSNDLEITRLVLYMKNLVEMIKEQVQNIE